VIAGEPTLARNFPNQDIVGSNPITRSRRSETAAAQAAVSFYGPRGRGDGYLRRGWQTLLVPEQRDEVERRNTFDIFDVVLIGKRKPGLERGTHK